MDKLELYLWGIGLQAHGTTAIAGGVLDCRSGRRGEKILGGRSSGHLVSADATEIPCGILAKSSKNLQRDQAVRRLKTVRINYPIARSCCQVFDRAGHVRISVPLTLRRFGNCGSVEKHPDRFALHVSKWRAMP